MDLIQWFRASLLERRVTSSQIRHPGYLGNFMVFIPFAYIISTNQIYTLVATVLFTLIYMKRMSTEEQMLINSLGRDYIDLMKKTWRLIPYIY
jgi:protein-S-isoprenylcysteine O-methyltransferase Ste14